MAGCTVVARGLCCVVYGRSGRSLVIDELRSMCGFVCLSSFIYIPLHGARRAMAAAAFIHLNLFLTPASFRGHGGVLLLFYPTSPARKFATTKEKTRKNTKGP